MSGRGKAWLSQWIGTQRKSSSKRKNDGAAKNKKKEQLVIDLLDSSSSDDDDDKNDANNNSETKRQQISVGAAASAESTAIDASLGSGCSEEFTSLKPAPSKNSITADTLMESTEFFSAKKSSSSSAADHTPPTSTIATTTAVKTSASPSHFMTPPQEMDSNTPKKPPAAAVTKSTITTTTNTSSLLDASPSTNAAFHKALAEASGLPQFQVVNTVMAKKKRRRKLQESKRAEPEDHVASRDAAPPTTAKSPDDPLIARPKISNVRSSGIKKRPPVLQNQNQPQASTTKPLSVRNGTSLSQTDSLTVVTRTKKQQGVNSNHPPDKSHSSSDSVTSVTQAGASAASRVEGVENSTIKHRLVPTTAKLAKQCWKCAVDLKLPEDQICVYFLHPHLLLKVPMCSVCADEVAAVELNAPDDSLSSSSDNSTYCAGCAASEEDVETFLLCDKDGSNNGGKPCHRAFCIDCIAKVHGGGLNGAKAVQKLLHDGNDWHCPVCSPPAELVQLQEQVARDARTREEKQRTVDEIIPELEYAEEEKKRCEDELDRDIDEIANEFRQELQRENVSLEESELEQLLHEEVSLWKEKWQSHEKRVSDFISVLQDELDIEHLITPAICYDQYLKQSTIRRPNSDDSSDEEEEEWAKLAAKSISKRKKEEEKVFRKGPLPPPKEISFQDVEDLATDFKSDNDDDHHPSKLRSGFSGRRPTKEEYKDALENEQELNIQVKMVVDDEEDAEETAEEKRQVSRRKSSGLVVRSEYERMRVRSTRKHSATRERSLVRTKTNKRSLDETATEEPVSTPHSSRASSRIEGETSSSKKRRAVKALNFSSSDSSTDGNLESASKNIFFPGSASSLPLVLCDGEKENDEGKRTVRTVIVAKQLAEQLKQHQREGVKFLWRNCFSDYESLPDGDSSQIGGCILAHNMGLGKSLSTIALIYTVMNDSSMVSSTGTPLVQCTLIIAPVNTLMNWEQEFDKWLEWSKSPCVVYNLASVDKNARISTVKKWSERGGVMLMSDHAFFRMKDVSIQPDLIVLDEAHTMLKNSKNQVFQALLAVNTPRRIALTGSPFQNNLLEYFTMINFVRNNVFGDVSEAEFEKEYVSKIQKGMPSDATIREQYESLEASSRLNRILEPYVQRVDASELRRDLPPIQQVVLHVRPSRLQSKLYRRFKSKQKLNGKMKNFFYSYRELGPIHNHPASLLFPSASKAQKSSNASDGESAPAEKSWWKASVDREGEDEIKNVNHGYKIVLLLHILAYANSLNDKVLIFANSLSTLNYIEYVLSLDDWSEHVPLIREKFPGVKLGGWQKSKDYLRIDGGVHASDRGDMIDQFNTNDVDGGFKAFLLASKAGGIGINLTAANRVVIVDDHFNPTVATQSIFRAYRYGQTKNVFVYRLLTQGTMEERVYSRIVNKTGLALRVIDQKSITRSFTKAEVDSLMQNLTWVQCDRCEKWRVLVGEDEKDLPALWYCEMNENDPINNKCDATEKDQLWYEKRYFSESGEGDSATDKTSSPLKVISKSSKSPSKPSENAENDEILQHLLELKGNKSTNLISKHVFHDSLLEAKQSDVELENARRELERAREESAQKASGSAGDASETNSDSKVDAEKEPVSVAHPKVQDVNDSALDEGSADKVSSPTSSTERKRPFDNSDEKLPAQDSPVNNDKQQHDRKSPSVVVVETSTTDESSADGKPAETGDENSKKKARKAPPPAAGQSQSDAIDLCSDDDTSATD